MTGKPKLGKESLLKELKTLYKQVEKLQRRVARTTTVRTFVWDSVLGIQNAIQDSIDIVEGWEDD
jgi:hypothetical protein